MLNNGMLGNDGGACRTLRLLAPVVLATVVLLLPTAAQAAPFSASVQVNPSSLQASTQTQSSPANPTLTQLTSFSYPDQTDTVKSVTVDLAAGVLANPAAVTTQCSQDQFNANQCPAGSQIGSGTATANTMDAHGGSGHGTVTMPIKLFLIPQRVPSRAVELGSGDPSALAKIGLIAYLDGVPQVYSVRPVRS